MKLHLEALEPRDCPALIAHTGTFTPFPGYEGPVESVTSGDVTVVTADRIPHVKIFVGGEETASFYAYDPAFDGGINLATDGEHVATGTDSGAPHVREFTLHGVEIQSFFAGNPLSIRGVRVGYPTPDPTVLSLRPEAKYQIYLDGATAAVVQGVADIFASFNVGVTNGFPSSTDPRRIATVIFGGEQKNGNGGRAVIGGLFQQSELTSIPARVYSDSLSERQQVLAAAHETAHLFGAVHVTDPRSIMFSGLAGGFEFDPLNESILTQRIGSKD